MVVVHRLTCLVLLSALLGAVPAAAQEQATETEAYFPQRLTAEDLLYTCAASSLTSMGWGRRRYCAGFFSGVEEAMRLRQQQLSEAANDSLCLPAGTSARDLAGVYKRYASRSGTDLTLPAVALVIAALQEAFPCR